MPVSQEAKVEIQLGKGAWWVILLGFALAVAIGIVLVAVAAGVFMILVSVAVIASSALYLRRWLKPRRTPAQEAHDGGQIIEGEYRRIDGGNIDPKA
jgi:membrane protein implicated in regulation of membrane protease activity